MSCRQIFWAKKRCDFGARTRQFSDLHDCSVISTYLNMERATPSTSSKWGAILKSFGIYCRLYWQPTSFPVSAHYFFPKFYGKVRLKKKHHNLIISNNFFSLKGTVYSSRFCVHTSKIKSWKAKTKHSSFNSSDTIYVMALFDCRPTFRHFMSPMASK